MSDPAKTVYSCPDCDRPILNRKFNKCLYCNATIPGELLFTDIEIREKEEKYKKQMEENEKKDEIIEIQYLENIYTVLNGLIL